MSCFVHFCFLLGRFFAAASHTLVTNVASKRLVDWEVSDEMCCDVGDGPIANIRSKKTDTEKVSCCTVFARIKGPSIISPGGGTCDQVKRSLGRTIF